ncbi:MAG: DUF1311 domain-containing protein [Devosiaceae bacterium]|nr:DUF1311 domain-containing protein [Devosiaceae bacterium MH13]
MTMLSTTRLTRPLAALAIAASLGAMALSPAPAASQSFNCANAGTQTEHAICANGYLASLDSEMAATYQAVRAQLSGSNREILVAEQRQWLRYRNSCGGSCKCLEAAYLNQIGALNDWFPY